MIRKRASLPRWRDEFKVMRRNCETDWCDACPGFQALAGAVPSKYFRGDAAFADHGPGARRNHITGSRVVLEILLDDDYPDRRAGQQHRR